jgi:ribose 5-phosphate isomerase B
MALNTEDEIHRIVEKVIARTLGAKEQTGTPVSFPAPIPPVSAPKPAEIPAKQPSKKIVAIGTDHGGLELKEVLKLTLAELGYEVLDCGTNSKDAVDYPDYAAKVATLVAQGKAWRGVMIDGAGIGSCMAANKIDGIRAAMCYDYATAANSREHNDANVLTLGAGLIGVNQAKLILKTWLATEFGGGRHAGRVNKIMALESGALKDGK